jgi:hypothetical protein
VFYDLCFIVFYLVYFVVYISYFTLSCFLVNMACASKFFFKGIKDGGLVASNTLDRISPTVDKG